MPAVYPEIRMNTSAASPNITVWSVNCATMLSGRWSTKMEKRVEAAEKIEPQVASRFRH